MDGYRFDDLAKKLAGGASRRAALKGFAGGIVAGLTALSGGGAGADARTRQPNGAACSRASDCASFVCANGVCCSTPCPGQCESCANGACQPVTGAPEAERPPCPGNGPCGATCDSIQRAFCASFPRADTICGPSTCANGWQTTYACAGNGVCAPTTTNCAPFGCDASGMACASACVSDDECAPGSHCDAGACLPDEGLGAACDEDSDCQHGHCVDSVCCAAVW